MKKEDYPAIVCLAALALFIWLRDTSWMSTYDDTLPILVTLPMYFWLGGPWSLHKERQPVAFGRLIVATIVLLVGLITNLTILLGLAWTLFFWAWWTTRITANELPKAKKLLILPLMAFPWIALDAEPVGWWFRLSGAAVTGKVFALGGLPVVREGTQLLLGDLPISVEPACAGLNTLQSMLIAGSVGAYIYLSNTNRYWWNIPLLIVMAWLANTIRIIALCTAAIVVSPEFALGPFHDIGGWAVLIIMFLLCWTLFSLQEPKKKAPRKANHAP